MLLLPEDPIVYVCICISLGAEQGIYMRPQCDLLTDSSVIDQGVHIE